MEEEKKPVKGQEFLQRFGRVLAGQSQNPQNPKTDAQQYKEKTDTLEAQDSYLQTKDRMENPPSAKEAQAKREQDLAERATAAETRAREAEDKIRSSNEEAKKEAEQAAVQAHQEAEQAKGELHNHQINMLSEKLDDVLKSKKPLQEQMDEYFVFADQMAGKMGWVKPGAITPSSENPQISLEIARLHIEDARAAREHDRQMEKDKRDWDLRIMELSDKREYDKAKLEQEGKKSDAIFQAPQLFGAALAQGLAERAGGGTGSPGAISQQQPGPQTFKFKAPEGESGEVDCPVCHTPVGIGPHSDLAECVNCNTKFKIERVPATSVAEAEEEK